MGALTVQAGPPVVRTRRPSPVYSSQLGDNGMVRRNRKGRTLSSQIIENVAVRYQGSHQFLTPDELFQVYRISLDVRACIDRTVRQLATWNHAVIPNVDPTHDLYDVAMDLAAEANRFLAAPTLNGETWQTWMTKLCRDLLNYDAMAMEVCDKADGTLEELPAIHGGYVQPVEDDRGRLLYYIQTIPGGDETIRFEPDELVYLNLFPNTSFPGGTPIIECIVNEILTRLGAARHVLLAYDADEVPPGILLIAGLGGKAATRMEEALQNTSGADHKLRVFSNDNPKPMSANWVELSRSFKDLDLKDVLKEIKRDIWRAFGCQPVIMGDTEATPRATAEVQDDLGDSQLIRPILEQLQALLNMRVMPRLVGDPELVHLVTFEFEGLEGKGQTKEDDKTESEALAIDFDRGAVTINEYREVKGRLPFEDGDVSFLKVGGGEGYRRLSVMLGDLEAVPASDVAEDAAEDDSSDVDDEEAPGEIDAEARPVPHRSKLRKPKHTRLKLFPGKGRSRTYWGHLDEHEGCSCEPTRSFRAADDLLPSDWQPAGRFKDVRTMDLPSLGRAIIDYKRKVSPLYRRANLDVVSAFRSYLADGRLSPEEALVLASRVGSIVDTLAEKWSATTEPNYRRAARIGRDAAADMTGLQVAEDWRERADAYHDMAMGYLTGTRGLITDLRAQLQTVISASIRGSQTQQEVRALRIRQGLDDEDLEAATILAAAAAAFGRNQHRIDNWSGRLVDLSNAMLVNGLQEQAPEVTDESGNAKPTAWMCEWANVGDERMCVTCDQQGSRGFIPLSELDVFPGGDTECRARCRCVLVTWLQTEVDDGTAVLLGGAAS